MSEWKPGFRASLRGCKVTLTLGSDQVRDKKTGSSALMTWVDELVSLDDLLATEIVSPNHLYTGPYAETG